MKRNLLVLGLLALGNAFDASAAGFPLVAPASLDVGIETRAERLEIRWPLHSPDGRQVYNLVCRGGSDDYTDELSTRTRINYVPNLMCVLNEGSVDGEGSLLADHREAPWHSRGQFRWTQLVGECARDPAYGDHRVFSLRGMRLELAARDKVMADGKLAFFVMHFQVRSDPSARHSAPVAVDSPRQPPGCR